MIDMIFWWIGAAVSVAGGILLLAVLAGVALNRVLYLTGASKHILAAYGRILKERRDKDFHGA